MAQEKKIKLADLLVNTENYRFEVLGSQKEAIDKIIENQKDNLYSLAEHIIKNGLNPNDKVQVVKSNHDKTKFITLEGNRRIVTLKCLNNPDLIDISDFSKLRTKFKKLIDNNRDKVISSVNCVVYGDAKEADVWIGLKHGYGLSGTYTDTWGPIQKQRFEEKTNGKTSTTLQIINLIKNSKDVDDSIKADIDKINSTNLNRLIDDPEVRRFLGFEINNGIIQSTVDEKEVIKGLTQVVKDVLDPNFSVKRIYSKQDRNDYLNKFPLKQRPDISVKAEKTWQTTTVNSSSKTSTSASKPKTVPTIRKVLIPKNCVLTISNPKINSIYRNELQKLDVNAYPNAVAVLYRVFIELSVDTYIEHHKLTVSVSSAKSGTDFQQKVNMVASHLDSKKLADATICKGIKTAIKDKNDIMGIDTWHAYVHNNRFVPKADNLILTWNNIQDFVTALWNNIN